MSTLVSNHRGSLIGSVFAVFLALHGVAHFVGVSGSIEAMTDNDPMDLLGGSVSTSSEVVLGALAVAWAMLGVGFLMVAVLVLRHNPAAASLVVAVSAASLCVGVVCLWEGVVGVVINVALVAVALAMPQAVGLPASRRTPTSA